MMNRESNDNEWSSLDYEQKNEVLYLKQKALLDQFLMTGAISQAQHDKSLHDLTEKMGYATIPVHGLLAERPPYHKENEERPRPLNLSIGKNDRGR